MVEIVLTKNETEKRIIQSSAIGEYVFLNGGNGSDSQDQLFMKSDKNWWTDIRTGLSYHEQFLIDSKFTGARKVKKLRIEVILD